MWFFFLPVSTWSSALFSRRLLLHSVVSTITDNTTCPYCTHTQHHNIAHVQLLEMNMEDCGGSVTHPINFYFSESVLDLRAVDWNLEEDDVLLVDVLLVDVLCGTPVRLWQAVAEPVVYLDVGLGVRTEALRLHLGRELWEESGALWVGGDGGSWRVGLCRRHRGLLSDWRVGGGDGGGDGGCWGCPVPQPLGDWVDLTKTYQS